MPAIHSSPHPANDPGLKWNSNEDSMPRNPYPDVGGPGGFEPGYDAEQWTGGQSFAGREYYPGSMPRPTQNYNSPWSHASQFDTGNGSRRRTEREHDRNHRYSHHRHTNHIEDNRMSHPWAGRQRAASFDDRIPSRMSHAQFESVFDEEEGEEDFEYDSYDEEEPVFLPPKMGRARAWDSSEEEDFEDELDEDEELLDDEDEDDESYAEAVRANMRQHGHGHGHGHGMMPRRGQPHRLHGNMRRSSPPPLESPPDSPPPLSRGMPSARGMDPRMMRGRGVDPRMMRGRRMDPRMVNRGGMRIPIRGGSPRSPSRERSIPIHRERVPKKRTRFVDSSSSSSGDGWVFQHGAARLRRSSSTGGGIKKAMRWLTGPNGTPATLHPLLRVASLLRPPMLTWYVSRPPVPIRAGIPVGFAVASFSEPATSPPVAYMRLLVPIPGLGGAQWTVDVWPLGSPYATPNQIPPSPFSFTGSPSAFARALPSSPFPEYGAGIGPGAFVRCADVLHALYAMLQRRAVANDFWALDERRRDRVSKAFWVRCRTVSAAATGMNMVASPRRRERDAAPPSLVQEEMDRQVNSGVKRIDFMEGRTRWEGLEGSGTDEWVVRLGRG